MEAVYYFNNGYSCSESIIKWAVDENLCPENLFNCATSFSGGMSSGCLCGAIAASQMIIGFNFERTEARIYAAKFIDEFKKRNKFTCCKILTQGIDDRKKHCSKMVSDCVEILNEMIKVKI